MMTCLRRLSIVGIFIGISVLNAFSYGNVGVENATGVDEDWSECPIYYLPENTNSLLLSFSTVNTAHWLWVNGVWDSSYDTTGWGYKERSGYLPLTQFACNQYYLLQMYDGDGVRSMATSAFPANKVGDPFYILRYKDYNGASLATGSTHSLYFSLPGNTEISHDNGITWKSVDGSTRLYEASEISEGTVLYRKQDGSNYSSIVRINWTDVVPEQILTQVDNNTKTVDDSICLTLDISPKETYSYQWNHNGSPIAGANESSYIIDKIKSADAGSYSCTVSNAVSSVTSKEVALVVNKAQQNITFGEFEVKTCGDDDIILPQTTDKGLTILYQSINENVASVTENIIKITGPGETVIVASQPGNEDYLPAATISHKLYVNKIAQNIIFPDIPVKTFGDEPFTLPDVTDRNLPVSYTSTNEKIAIVKSNVVTIVGAGETEIIANQAGDRIHATAQPVTQKLRVNKSTQTIVFVPLETKTYGDPAVVLNELTDRGLPITYKASNDVVTVKDNRLIINHPGNVVISASQMGDANYMPAEEKTQTLIVNKGLQTIWFEQPESRSYGSPDILLPENTDKGLAINYDVDNENVVKIDGNRMSIVGAGECIITASQQGSDLYAPASTVKRPFTVTKAYQHLTFDELPEYTYGANNITLSALSDMNTQVYFISSNDDIATVDGNTLTIHSAGSCYITAMASGNDNIFDATPVQHKLVINKANQTVTMGYLEDRTYGDTPILLSATNDRNVSMIYESSDPDKLMITGNTAVIKGAGDVKITAIQAGDKNYNEASASTTLHINKAVLTARVENEVKQYGDYNPEFNIIYTGFVNNDTELDLKQTPSCTTTAKENSDVGTYDVSIVPVYDDNYTINYQNGHLTIEKTPLYVTAENKEKVYGDENPQFTIHYDGFKLNENETVLNKIPLVSSEVGLESSVGEYKININGGESKNYNFIYVPGTLSIKKAQLTAKLQSETVEYGDEPKCIITYEGFKNHDNERCLDFPPRVVKMTTIKSEPGIYEMYIDGGLDDNYKINALQTTEYLEITKAPLEISLPRIEREYGQENPDFTRYYIFDGLKNDDTPSSLYQLPTALCEATSDSWYGEYHIELSGGYDSRYEFFLNNGVMTILPTSSIDDIITDTCECFTVYSLNGTMLFNNVKKEQLYHLCPGIYIINGKKVLVR